MASTEEGTGYFPARTNNTLNQNTEQPRATQHHEHGYAPEEIEQLDPELERRRSSNTDVEYTTPPVAPGLNRSETSRSTRLSREKTYEPINLGDREALHRLASEFGGNAELVRTATRASQGPSGLERRDTLVGLEIGDSVLDPSSPDFDLYKWVRMVCR